MCEVCESMLAAEHTERPGAELCPKCRRFPLDVEVRLDLSQWDYVAPELRNEVGAVEPAMSDFADVVLTRAPETPDGPIPEVTDEESDEHVPTCYHCYQIDSGLAELCPVCGDSYLPPAMRKPHRA